MAKPAKAPALALNLADFENGVIEVQGVYSKDKWVASATFDPRAVTADVGAWVVAGMNGEQAIVAAKLADNALAANGKAWDVMAWKWSELNGRWAEDELFALFPHDVIAKAGQVTEIEAVLCGGHDWINEINVRELVGCGEAQAEVVRVDPGFARDKLQRGERIHVGLHARDAKDMQAFSALAMSIDGNNMPVFHGARQNPFANEVVTSVYDSAKFEELDVNRSSFYVEGRGAVQVNAHLHGQEARRENVYSICRDAMRAVHIDAENAFECSFFLTEESYRMGGGEPSRIVEIEMSLDAARALSFDDVAKLQNASSRRLLYDVAAAARNIPYDPNDWKDDLTAFRDVDWKSRDAAALAARRLDSAEGPARKASPTVSDKAEKTAEPNPAEDMTRAAGARGHEQTARQIKQQRGGR